MAKTDKTAQFVGDLEALEQSLTASALWRGRQPGEALIGPFARFLAALPLLPGRRRLQVGRVAVRAQIAALVRYERRLRRLAGRAAASQAGEARATRPGGMEDPLARGPQRFRAAAPALLRFRNDSPLPAEGNAGDVPRLWRPCPRAFRDDPEGTAAEIAGRARALALPASCLLGADVLATSHESTSAGFPDDRIGSVLRDALSVQVAPSDLPDSEEVAALRAEALDALSPLPDGMTALAACHRGLVAAIGGTPAQAEALADAMMAAELDVMAARARPDPDLAPLLVAVGRHGVTRLLFGCDVLTSEALAALAHRVAPAAAAAIDRVLVEAYTPAAGELGRFGRLAKATRHSPGALLVLSDHWAPDLRDASAEGCAVLWWGQP